MSTEQKIFVGDVVYGAPSPEIGLYKVLEFIPESRMREIYEEEHGRASKYPGGDALIVLPLIYKNGKQPPKPNPQRIHASWFNTPNKKQLEEIRNKLQQHLEKAQDALNDFADILVEL